MCDELPVIKIREDQPLALNGFRFQLLPMLAVFAVVTVVLGLWGRLRYERELESSQRRDTLIGACPWYSYEPSVLYNHHLDVASPQTLLNAEGLNFSLSEKAQQVDDQAITLISSLDHLKCINLCGTKVSDKGLLELGSCKSLEFVFVKKSAVTKEGVVRFRKKYPNCVIYGDGDRVPHDLCVWCYLFTHYYAEKFGP